MYGGFFTQGEPGARGLPGSPGGQVSVLSSVSMTFVSGSTDILRVLLLLLRVRLEVRESQAKQEILDQW